MKKTKIYLALGIMTGTSMDGIDLSLINTDGKSYVRVINEKNYQYSHKLQIQFKKIMNNKKNMNNINDYFIKYDDKVTKIIIKYINKFIKEFKIKNTKIDLISLSGQTFYHNPKKKISIQLGSSKKICNYFKINTISDFRKNDIKNGGQGAPIGTYYHKFLLKKIDTKAMIINFGGVSNFTMMHNKKLYSSDIGPANSLSDDLTFKFYKQKYDNNGKFALLGKPNVKIIKKFSNDNFFKINFPKSIDRNHFKKYYNLLSKLNKNDAICTANHLVIKSVEILLNKKNFNHINKIIITGGGRKNKYLINHLIKSLSNLKIHIVDEFGFNGDLIESQMFGYIGVRSYKNMIISSPHTTGVKKSISGGILYKTPIRD